MRIGVNGRFLVAKRTGVQRAAYNLVKTLVEVDRENEYFLFTGESQLDNADWKKANVQVVPSKLRAGESFRNHIWEQFSLPRLAKKYKIDILHSPANMAPLFYSGKSIVNIHDLCFVVNPQWYSFSFHTLYNIVIPRLARRATKVITNSNNSRNDLIQFCRIGADRVCLIYWAVDDIFMKQEEPVTRSSVVPSDEYILYVGSLEPRKNIKVLVEAYEKLRIDHPELNTKLILIGGESPLFADVRFTTKNYTKDVIFKGFVDDQMLKEYYQHASLVAYPSLYEGFGLPPLEAMASGTPVVTSNTSSIPEVVGEAALMVSPNDVNQLAKCMARVLTDKDLREDLRARGQAQVAAFNWYRVAKNVLSVYHEVHNSGEKGVSLPYIPFETWKRLNEIEKNWMMT